MRIFPLSASVALEDVLSDIEVEFAVLDFSELDAVIDLHPADVIKRAAERMIARLVLIFLLIVFPPHFFYTFFNLQLHYRELRLGTN
jgi:hypothetical protein